MLPYGQRAKDRGVCVIWTRLVWIKVVEDDRRQSLSKVPNVRYSRVSLLSGEGFAIF